MRVAPEKHASNSLEISICPVPGYRQRYKWSAKSCRRVTRHVADQSRRGRINAEKKKSGRGAYPAWVISREEWGAFTAGVRADRFGLR